MTRPAGVLAVMILLTVASIGCAGRGPAEPATSGPQTTTIEVPYDELLNQKQVARAVTLRVGDFLQVSLASNASTGFRWAPDMEISDPGVLAQTGHEAVGPAQGSGPGASGREVWVLQAMSAGKATVTTGYGRPWEGGEKDSWTFTAEVTVC